MTQGGFVAQPDDLQSSASAYHAVAVQLATVYGTLATQLDAEGACWGTDEIGQAFGTKYAPAALSALQHMSGTTEGLLSMVDGICSWARNYVDADALAQADAAALAARTPTATPAAGGP